MHPGEQNPEPTGEEIDSPRSTREKTTESEDQEFDSCLSPPPSKCIGNMKTAPPLLKCKLLRTLSAYPNLREIRRLTLSPPPLEKNRSCPVKRRIYASRGEYGAYNDNKKRRFFLPETDIFRTMFDETGCEWETDNSEDEDMD
eukprot:Gb_09543 [translate_table: standard]